MRCTVSKKNKKPPKHFCYFFKGPYFFFRTFGFFQKKYFAKSSINKSIIYFKILHSFFLQVFDVLKFFVCFVFDASRHFLWANKINTWTIFFYVFTIFVVVYSNVSRAMLLFLSKEQHCCCHIYTTNHHVVFLAIHSSWLVRNWYSPLAKKKLLIYPSVASAGPV